MSQEVKVVEVKVEGLVFKVTNPVRVMPKAKRKGRSFYIHIPKDIALQLGLENNDAVVALIYKIVDVKPASRETVTERLGAE